MHLLFLLLAVTSDGAFVGLFTKVKIGGRGPAGACSWMVPALRGSLALAVMGAWSWMQRTFREVDVEAFGEAFTLRGEVALVEPGVPGPGHAHTHVSAMTRLPPTSARLVRTAASNLLLLTMIWIFLSSRPPVLPAVRSARGGP
jgi:hypothetical protein